MTYVDSADLAATGPGQGAAMVGFSQGLTGAIARNANEKLRESVSVKDFGATGDGTTNDRSFILAARDSGATSLFFPKGVYRIDGKITFGDSDQVMHLHFEAGSRILTDAYSGICAIEVLKQVFSISGICDLKSAGSMSDGLSSVGLRLGSTTQGIAYFEIERLRLEGFSGRGLLAFSPVNVKIGRIDGYSCPYIVSFEKDTAGHAGTAIAIEHAYLSGGMRGLNLEGVGWTEIGTLVLEYCGHATQADGALHLKQVGTVVIRNIYGEQNARNMVIDDSTPTILGGSMFTATAPDVISYSGVAFTDRGAVRLVGNSVRAARLLPDDLMQRDLQIGSNLVVPLSGGSVRFGKTTSATFSGAATSGTWTSILSVTGQSGDAAARSVYDYVVRLGQGASSTGIDSGKIMNGTLYSATGTTPTWLRMSGDQLQVLSPSTGAGLQYAGEVLIRNGDTF